MDQICLVLLILAGKTPLARALDLVEDDAVVTSFNDLQRVVRTPRPRTRMAPSLVIDEPGERGSTRPTGSVARDASRVRAGYRAGSDRGSPNQGSTLVSKRVTEQIRSPASVRTKRPVPWRILVGARRYAPNAGWPLARVGTRSNLRPEPIMRP